MKNLLLVVFSFFFLSSGFGSSMSKDLLEKYQSLSYGQQQELTLAHFGIEEASYCPQKVKDLREKGASWSEIIDLINKKDPSVIATVAHLE